MGPTTGIQITTRFFDTLSLEDVKNILPPNFSLRHLDNSITLGQQGDGDYFLISVDTFYGKKPRRDKYLTALKANQVLEEGLTDSRSMECFLYGPFCDALEENLSREEEQGVWSAKDTKQDVKVAWILLHRPYVKSYRGAWKGWHPLSILLGPESSPNCQMWLLLGLSAKDSCMSLYSKKGVIPFPVVDLTSSPSSLLSSRTPSPVSPSPPPQRMPSPSLLSLSPPRMSPPPLILLLPSPPPPVISQPPSTTTTMTTTTTTMNSHSPTAVSRLSTQSIQSPSLLQTSSVHPIPSSSIHPIPSSSIHPSPPAIQHPRIHPTSRLIPPSNHSPRSPRKAVSAKPSPQPKPSTSGLSFPPKQPVQNNSPTKSPAKNKHKSPGKPKGPAQGRSRPIHQPKLKAKAAPRYIVSPLSEANHNSKMSVGGVVVEVVKAGHLTKNGNKYDIFKVSDKSLTDPDASQTHMMVKVFHNDSTHWPEEGNPMRGDVVIFKDMMCKLHNDKLEGIVYTVRMVCVVKREGNDLTWHCKSENSPGNIGNAEKIALEFFEWWDKEGRTFQYGRHGVNLSSRHAVSIPDSDISSAGGKGLFNLFCQVVKKTIYPRTGNPKAVLRVCDGTRTSFRFEEITHNPNEELEESLLVFGCVGSLEVDILVQFPVVLQVIKDLQVDSYVQLKGVDSLPLSDGRRKLIFLMSDEEDLIVLGTDDQKLPPLRDRVEQARAEEALEEASPTEMSDDGCSLDTELTKETHTSVGLRMRPTTQGSPMTQVPTNSLDFIVKDNWRRRKVRGTPTPTSTTQLPNDSLEIHIHNHWKSPERDSPARKRRRLNSGTQEPSTLPSSPRHSPHITRSPQPSTSRQPSTPSPTSRKSIQPSTPPRPTLQPSTLPRSNSRQTTHPSTPPSQNMQPSTPPHSTSRQTPYPSTPPSQIIPPSPPPRHTIHSTSPLAFTSKQTTHSSTSPLSSSHLSKALPPSTSRQHPSILSDWRKVIVDNSSHEVQANSAVPKAPHSPIRLSFHTEVTGEVKKTSLEKFYIEGKVGELHHVKAVLTDIRAITAYGCLWKEGPEHVCLHQWVWGWCTKCNCVFDNRQLKHSSPSPQDTPYLVQCKLCSHEHNDENRDEPGVIPPHSLTVRPPPTVVPFIRIKIELEDPVSHLRLTARLGGDDATLFFGVTPTFEWSEVDGEAQVVVEALLTQNPSLHLGLIKKQMVGGMETHIINTALHSPVSRSKRSSHRLSPPIPALPQPAPATSLLPHPAPATSLLPQPAPATSPLLQPAPAASPLPQLALATSPLPQPAPATSPLPQPAPATSPLPQPAPATSPLPQPAPATPSLPQPAPATSPLPQPAPATPSLPQPSCPCICPQCPHHSFSLPIPLLQLTPFHRKSSPVAPSHNNPSSATPSCYKMSPATPSHHGQSPATPSCHSPSPATPSHHNPSPATPSHHHHTKSPEPTATSLPETSCTNAQSSPITRTTHLNKVQNCPSHSHDESQTTSTPPRSPSDCTQSSQCYTTPPETQSDLPPPHTCTTLPQPDSSHTFY